MRPIQMKRQMFWCINSDWYFGMSRVVKWKIAIEMPLLWSADGNLTTIWNRLYCHSNNQWMAKETLLIFDLFICTPIFSNVFWDKYFMEKQKLICFLFSVCLLWHRRFAHRFIRISFAVGRCLLKSLLFTEFWMECNNSWFGRSHRQKERRERNVQIKGVFQCGRLFCQWNGIEIRF